MRKKLLTLLLVLCMVLTLAPAALADNDVLGAAPGDDGVRETDFLDDQPHTDADFADMEVVPLTVEDFTTKIDAVKALLTANAANEAILEAFHVVTDLYETLSADLTILNIRKSVDVRDTESQDLYAKLQEVSLNVYDPFIFLIQEILKSGCREAFITADKLTESDVEYYETYGGMSQEEKDLSMKLTELEDGFMVAYNEGDIDAMVEYYMDVLETNNEMMAFTEGYDNYAEYAYAEVYGRDYTVEDAQAFFDAVKEYIVPFLVEYDTVCSFESNAAGEAGAEIMYGDYTGDETLAAIRPYIGKMSSELLDAYDYMIDHHLYDITARDSKYDGGFTTQIPVYNAPFFFNSPYGDVNDFSTIIHEFGHYNNFYSHPNTWNEGSCSIDVAEVHSQALELLFTQFYGDFFGDFANIVENNVIENLLISGVLNGARMAELELYAYTTEDVTADMISAKFEELSGEYYLNGSGTDWVTIPHLTRQPLYYISYATSAIGALTFWTEAQEQGYDKATDLYLEFVSQPYYAEFQEEFEEILGVNPLDPAYVAEISDTLYEKLELEERQNSVYIFPDVTMSNPNFGVYMTLYQFELIHGDDDGLFHPDRDATRAEVAQTVYSFLTQFANDEDFAGIFSDVSGKWYEHAVNFCAAYGIVNGYVNEKGELVFDGDTPITREELCIIFYRLLSILQVSLDTTPSPELTASASPWAVDAMNALVNLGWLNPATEAQRHEIRDTLAVFLYRTLLELYA